MALLVWRERVEREGGGRACASHIRLVSLLSFHHSWASLPLLQDLALFLLEATAFFSKLESFPLSATSSPW